MADDFHLPSGLGDEQVAIRSDILNSVILQQQKRIAELEHKFQASQTEIQRLKRSLNGSRKGLASNGKAKGLPEIRKHRSSSSDQPRYWTQEEHNKFLIARDVLGSKNYASISEFVSSRTAKQVRTHAQKFEMRLARDSSSEVKKYPNEAMATSPLSSDFIDGQSFGPAPFAEPELNGSALDDVAFDDLESKWEMDDYWLDVDSTSMFS